MHVAFIVTYENLGLECLAAYLKAHGHRVSAVYAPFFFEDAFLDMPSFARTFKMDDRVVRRIVDLRADLVAFSTTTRDYRVHVRLAGAIKAALPGVRIVMGGIHPTLVPERVMANDCIDFVCMGEGEAALLELCERLQENGPVADVRNIWSRQDARIVRNPVRELIPDLDALPFPEKEIFYDAVPHWRSRFVDYLIMTARGCPYSCTYCYAEYVNKELYRGKRFYRRRSVGNVMEELECMRRSRSVRYISFFDDTFTTSRAWLHEFAEEYRKRGFHRQYRMSVLSRAEPLDADTCELLRSLRCAQVFIGVQVGNYRIRKEILNRGGLDSNETIVEACRRLREHGIPAHLDHIHELPYVTEAELIESARLYNRCRPVHIFQPNLYYFPRTGIVAHGREDGKLSEGDVRAIERGERCRPEATPDAELTGQYRFLFFLLPMLSRRAVDRMLARGAHKRKRLIRILEPLYPWLDTLRQLGLQWRRGADFRIYRYLLVYLSPQAVGLMTRALWRRVWGGGR